MIYFGLFQVNKFWFVLIIYSQIQDLPIRNTHLVLHKYRIAQVAENLVNAILEKPYFLIFLNFVILGQIGSLYTIITSWSYLSFEIILLFMLFGFNFFTVIHIFLHSLNKPNVTSAQFIKNLRRSKSARCPMFRKFLNSCPPLKVGMGDGTFYDKLTSFKIWQFCVDRLIRLLLLKWTYL